jgi:PAS domain S-box-containing protein
VNVRGSPLRGEAQPVEFLVSAVRPPDTTRSLLAHASSPRELLASLHEEVVWEAEAQTEQFLFVSAGAERLFGHPISEWRSDRRSFWLSHLHPDDVERCRAASRDALLAGRDHELEYRLRRPDGSIVWVREHVYLVRDAGGAVVKLRGVMTDTTERHRAEGALRDSEDRLRLALEAGQLGIWDFTPATDEMLCSPRCYELLAIPHGTRLTYDQFLSRIHPDDRERVRQTSQSILPGGGAELCDVEYRVDLPDGGERWVSSRSTIHRDPSGMPTRIVGTIGDITARVQSQRELERLLAQLTAEKLRAEQASRAKDEFLAMLGHELRNPLAPIQTALEVMALRQSGEPSREETVIRRQVHHLVRLLDDLLDVSRITSGQVALDRRPLDLADVVTQALELTSPLFELRRHHLSVDVPRGLHLVGDDRRLTQVVANLLDNAARYTEPGGIVVVRASRAGDHASLDVVDNGIGIAPDLLPRVFDLFVQAERAPDRAEGGLGIGLTLVRTFVRMHGGEVTASDNRPAAGSRFQVKLPILPDGVIAEAQPDRQLDEWPPRRDRQSSILVVDDNQDAADLLAEVLRDQGHDVQVAHDGPQALERLTAFRPEVAILDIGLPVMDGYELALALRDRLGPELRLLAVTGYGQERDRARSHEVGFERHFVKPVALTDLLEAIELD